MQKLCHIVAVAKSYNAISVDLHTMSSYPTNAVQERYYEVVIETLYSLNEYIRLYKNVHKDGEKRITELFNGDARNDIFASKVLLESLSYELQQIGV